MVGLPIPIKQDDGIPLIDDSTLTAPTFTSGNNRTQYISGGFKQVGSKVYVNLVLKLIADLNFADTWNTDDSDFNMRVANLPKASFPYWFPLDVMFLQKTTDRNNFVRETHGQAAVTSHGVEWGTSQNHSELYVSGQKNLTGTTEYILIYVRGEYEAV